MMKKKLTQKFLFTVFLTVSAFFNLLYASPELPPPPDDRGVGPGAPAITPIDMYQIILFLVAVLLVGYFYKKLKLTKI